MTDEEKEKNIQSGKAIVERLELEDKKRKEKEKGKGAKDLPDVGGIKLSYRGSSGSGKTIFANFNKNFKCVEFTLKKEHPILETEAILGYEPWIQFEPKERDRLMDAIFYEMVRLFNKEHFPEEYKDD